MHIFMQKFITGTLTDRNVKIFNLPCLTVQVILAIILLSLFLPEKAVADEDMRHRFYGIWKLLSIVQKTDAGEEKIDDYGRNPVGYINYAPDGRMMTIIVTGNRKKPVNKLITPNEATNLINSMTSYAGTYTVKANQVIHHIDVSWNQTWTGTEQVRNYQFKGNFLLLSMPTYVDKNGNKITITLIWKKITE